MRQASSDTLQDWECRLLDLVGAWSTDRVTSRDTAGPLGSVACSRVALWRGRAWRRAEALQERGTGLPGGSCYGLELYTTAVTGSYISLNLFRRLRMVSTTRPTRQPVTS